MKHLTLITSFLICAPILMNAQISSGSFTNNYPSVTKKENTAIFVEPKQQKNLFKINLTALPIKNYSFQYERVLNKSISIALGYRIMPSSTLPFKSFLVKQFGNDDPQAEVLIRNFQLANYAFTPEVRFYLGKKGYGRGFYIAPFFRYAKFTGDNMQVEYQNTNNVTSRLNLSGKLNGSTGGLLFGAQWALSKYICLDWWIIGFHFGKGNGTFDGIPTVPLTLAEQNDIRKTLEDLDIPMIKKTVEVTTNKVSVTMDGMWGGLRGGILLGFKF